MLQKEPLADKSFLENMLYQSIDLTLARYQFHLIAFVIMPEHLRLLVYPTTHECKIDRLLAAIKRPFSYRIKSLLIEEQSPLLAELTIRSRPGKNSLSFLAGRARL